MTCLARRTCWEESKYELSPAKSVCYLKLCENSVKEGSKLCSECSKLPKKLGDVKVNPKELVLNLPDGSLIYRKIQGKEFASTYNAKRRLLVLCGDQPVTWPKSLPTQFDTPTLFARSVALAVQGLDKKISVSGWEVCYAKGEKGEMIPLQSIRSTATISQTMLLHGLLTDPYPDFSAIYGSPMFWKRVNRYGENIPTEWLCLAEEAEEKARERCKKANLEFYVENLETQRPADTNSEMPVKKPFPKAEDLPKAAKLPFKPITKFYTEKADEPEKVERDTQKIWKEELDGKDVWRCEEGFVFEDNDGKPGKLIGKYCPKDSEDSNDLKIF